MQPCYSIHLYNRNKEPLRKKIFVQESNYFPMAIKNKGEAESFDFVVCYSI